MMRRLLFVLGCISLFGCDSQPKAPPSPPKQTIVERKEKEALPRPKSISEASMKAILAKREHVLKFENYGDKGVSFLPEEERVKEIASWDRAKAEYILDGQNIGVGEVGWKSLEYIFSQLPARDRLSLGDYYGGGGFPFDQSKFSKLCSKHNINVGWPAK